MRAWADSLGGIYYPLLSDFWPHGKIAQEYGILRPEGYSERALFVIDRHGIIRYADVHDIDQQPDNEVLFAVLAEMEPELARRWAAQSSGAARSSGAAQRSGAAQTSEAALSSEAAEPNETRQPEASPQDLVLYCTPWCPDCKRARRFLELHGISYVEVDVSRDRAAAQRLRAWGGGQEITPTFEFQGKVVLDYDLAQLTKLLGIEDN